jgi:hypothetical protein
MIQALDLARENAALRDEVAWLRRSVAGLLRTNESTEDELCGSFTSRAPRDQDLDHTGHASTADGPTTARLVLVMPRRLALSYRLFVGLSHCSVVVDRRVTDRRRRPMDYGGHERRRRDRRSYRLDTPGVLVVPLPQQEAS